MSSKATQKFEHAIQDAVDLLSHFDKLNTQPPPTEIEVLKRASLIMALAALEIYFEDRLVEAVDAICGDGASTQAKFMKDSLALDLRTFHTPSAERVRPIFMRYLDVDITQGWAWNNMDPASARRKLNELAKTRGDIAHRSWRPGLTSQAERHIVNRDDMRRHIHFIRQLVAATDAQLASSIAASRPQS